MLLISHNFINYIKQVNDIGTKSKTTPQPLQWNGRDEQFELPSRKMKLRLALFGTLAFLVCLPQVYHALGLSSASQFAGISLKCQILLCLSINSCAASFHFVLLTKGKEIAGFINGLLQMEKKWNRHWEFNVEYETDKGFANKVKLTKRICKYQVELIVIMSVSAGLVGALLPALPINVLFFLERYSLETFKQNGMICQIVERAFLLFINSVALQMGARSGGFFIVLVAVGVNSMIAALYRFRRMMKKSIAMGSEAAANTSVRFYRQLQILLGLFCEIHRLVLAQYLFCVIVVQVVCMFMLVKIGRGEGGQSSLEENKLQNLAMSMFYGFVGLECLVVILGMFGFMADINHCSIELKADIRSQAAKSAGSGKGKVFKVSIESTGMVRWLPVRNVMKTCPNLRVVLGTNNFLEKTTPLKFEEEAFINTVNLLLIH